MVFGHGKSALVTGASSGIGRALALALAREGLDVLLVGRDKGRLEQVMREAGACARFLVADLATQEGIDHVAAFGPNQLDVLVHSAGYYVRTTVASTSLAEWCKSDGINLHAPMLLTAAFLPRLIAAQRQVVFINSSAGLSSGTHGVAAYSASKHALKAAADCLRQEVNAAGSAS
jgi:NAD(P)-dependent dehydrogenase (short-subunit alcohol dehydrogenase family)